MTTLLTDEEQEEVVDALRDLLKSKRGCLGKLRKLAKKILDRIELTE